jgi:hypothetical protein
MEKFVIWWCSLVGVTDDQAIHIAIGITTAVTLLYICYTVVVLMLWLMAHSR